MPSNTFNLKFGTIVGDWVEDTKDALIAIARDSATQLINQAQTTRDQGGNLPVLTGFLWQSGKTNIGSPPTGDEKGDASSTYSYNPSTIQADINNWSVGETLFFGWTAEYAVIQETRNGFAEMAAQDWTQIVKRSEEKVKKAFKI